MKKILFALILIVPMMKARSFSSPSILEPSACQQSINEYSNYQLKLANRYALLSKSETWGNDPQLSEYKKSMERLCSIK